MPRIAEKLEFQKGTLVGVVRFWLGGGTGPGSFRVRRLNGLWGVLN